MYDVDKGDNSHNQLSNVALDDLSLEFTLEISGCYLQYFVSHIFDSFFFPV